MPPLPPRRLLHRNKTGILRPEKNKPIPQTQEQVMIPLVSTAKTAAIPFASGWSAVALWQDMLRAWKAHHQRMADLGVHGGL